MRPILPELSTLQSSSATRIAANLVGGTQSFPELLGELQAPSDFAATKVQPHPEPAETPAFHLQLPYTQISGDGISLPITGTPLPGDRNVGTMEGGSKNETTVGDVAVDVDPKPTGEPVVERAAIEGAIITETISRSLSHQDKEHQDLAQQGLPDLLPVAFIDAKRPSFSKATQAREKVTGSDRGRPAQPAPPALPIIEPDLTEFRSVIAQEPSGTSSSGLPLSEDGAQNQPNGSASQASAAGAAPAPGPVPSAVPSVQPLAAIAAITAETAAPPPVEPRVDPKLGLQIEETIDHLTNAKEVARAARPEMTVRHAEFGAVTMRLDATGNDLRATLSSRDPGFVPAIQTALADRFVSAAAESSAAHNQPQPQSHSQSQSQAQSQAQSQSQAQRAQDQLGQNTGSSGAFTNLASGGGGAMGDPRYGSSPGSGQASSQPYLDQTGANEDDRATGDRSVANHDGSRGRRDLGLFA